MPVAVSLAKWPQGKPWMFRDNPARGDRGRPLLLGTGSVPGRALSPSHRRWKQRPRGTGPSSEARRWGCQVGQATKSLHGRPLASCV